MPKLIEITATYIRERFRFANADGDTIIGECWVNGEVNEPLTIKGQADLDELQPEQVYRFYGSHTTYKNRRTGQDEKQFAFQSFVLQQPHSRQGVIQYLRNAAEQVRVGFGVVRATRLWEMYGSEAVKMLREQPAEIAAALSTNPRHSLTAEQADKIAAVLRDQSSLEGCTLDLTDLLAGRGFPKGTARLATKLWGNKAANIIRRNPYRLMEFKGCGFKKTDALYLDLKLPPGKLKRQALCAWYTVATATSKDGNTWWPVEYAQEGIRQSIAAAELKIEPAIELATRGKATAIERTETNTGPLVAGGQRRWIAEGKKAANEQRLADKIAEMMRDE